MPHPGIARPVILPLRPSRTLADRGKHIVSVSSQCPHQGRTFSTSSALARHKRIKANPFTPTQNYVKYVRKEIEAGQKQPENLVQLKSMRTHTKEMHEQGKLPNDLGILPGTFISPTGAARPSFLKSPGLALRMETGRLWKRTKDFVSVLAYKFVGGRPYRKVRFFQTTPAAKRLHKQLYEALAAGDTTTISSMAIEGLRDRLKAKIMARPRGWTYQWTLHGYSGIPRVVSHRATLLPMQDAGGRRPSLRQAVVRIRSRQSLRVLDRSGQIVEGDTQEMRTVTEYVVIQKRILKGVDEGWKVWGTTEEAVVENKDELQSLMNPKLAEQAYV